MGLGRFQPGCPVFDRILIGIKKLEFEVIFHFYTFTTQFTHSESKTALYFL